MPRMTLSRRTILAPTPGLTGQQGAHRKAAFGEAGDCLEVDGATLSAGMRWFHARLLRRGEEVAAGFVNEAALMGQAGSDEIVGGGRG